MTYWTSPLSSLTVLPGNASLSATTKTPVSRMASRCLLRRVSRLAVRVAVVCSFRRPQCIDQQRRSVKIRIVLTFWDSLFRLSLGEVGADRCAASSLITLVRSSAPASLALLPPSRSSSLWPLMNVRLGGLNDTSPISCRPAVDAPFTSTTSQVRNRSEPLVRTNLLMTPCENSSSVPCALKLSKKAAITAFGTPCQRR